MEGQNDSALTRVEILGKEEWCTEVDVIGECPECEAEVPLVKGDMTGQLIDCPDCGVVLEIVSFNPVELVMAPEDAEDAGE